jgi:hypothetical protein
MSNQVKLSAYGALATIATSMSLVSVFSSSAWMLPVIGGIVLVAGCCALVRMSPLPSAFEPIIAAIAVLLLLTGLYAHSVAHLAIFPGRAALRRLGDVARGGFTEVRQLPTPAPAHHGLVMLTVIGVAAIALVVDLMCVTLRRAALAGLPLLALFTVCAATGHHGVSILSFIVAAVGYLWLLYADNRDKVARWGAAIGSGSRARPASAWSTDAASAPPPASLGRQVGAVAISLGVVVPLLIPGLHTGINKHSTSGAGSGDGSGSVQTFDPIVRVGADLRSLPTAPVVRYRTTTARPGYLRLTSLDQFNGRSFVEGQLTAPATATAGASLPIDPPLPPNSGPQVTTSYVMADKQAYYWLPVQATAIGVQVGDQWRYDPKSATIFSAATTTAGIRYTERSVPVTPSANQLASVPKPPVGLDVDLTLPETVSPQVKALEKRITAGAKSPYAAAVAIEDYLTGPTFRYDTSIPQDNGPDPLGDFLFHTHRGFCQQFATAMTVMARQHGIPARVAVGFTRGIQQPDGSWLVTTRDAHAWPELWFQGYGWLPFEPTPRGDGQAVTPSYATGKVSNGSHGNDNRNAGKDSKSTAQKKNQAHIPDAGNRSSTFNPRAVHRPHHHHTATAVVLWLLLALAVLLLVPGVTRVITRRRRYRQMTDPATAPAAAWAELRDVAIDLWAPWNDGRSPRQTASTLAAHIDATPSTLDALRSLARVEEESRYAPAVQLNGANPRADLRVIHDALAATRSGTRRASAKLFPRSALLTARTATSRGLLSVENAMHRASLVTAARRTRARLART